MRPIDDDTERALSGSRAGDRLVVWCWYGGRLAVEEPLPVSAWGLSGDTGRKAASLSLSVDDPSGELAPWLLEDPLGVGGARLQCTYIVGGAGSIPLGWYRITRSEPSEQWRAYLIDEGGTVTPDTPVPDGKRLAVVPGGASVSVSADDLAVVLDLDRLIAPESPPASATVVSEIQRLCAGILPVKVSAGITDVGVSEQLVYDGQTPRLEAIQDLAARVSAGVRLDGDGFLNVYPVTSEPVAVLKGGPEGLLVRVDRSQDISGLYNRFIVDGTADSERPVRAVADVAAGPLRVGGPHGTVPKFYSSQLIATQDQAEEYAKELRDTQLAGLTTDLKVTCAPLPHLEVGDWVSVFNPVVDGRVVSLDGRVVALSLRGGADGTQAMDLTVQCSYTAVQAAFSAGSDLTLAGERRTGPAPKGIFTLAGPLYVDNGDGTFTLSGSSIADNGDGTWTKT